MNSGNENKIKHSLKESWNFLYDPDKSDDQIPMETVMKIVEKAVETQFYEAGKRKPIMQKNIDEILA